MSVEENKQASREWHESFGTTHLKSAYEKFLAKDFRALFFGHGWVDRDAYVKGDQEFVAAFENVAMTVDDVAGEGDLVFCRMRWRGTQVRSVLGVESAERTSTLSASARTGFNRARSWSIFRCLM